MLALARFFRCRRAPLRRRCVVFVPFVFGVRLALAGLLGRGEECIERQLSGVL